jgi:hypothetical protein
MIRRKTLAILGVCASCLAAISAVGCGGASGSDGDEDAGGTSDLDTDTDTDSEVTLTNNPDACTDPWFIAPSESEIMQWAAIRLTPPSYPFHVTRVSYTVPAETYQSAGVTCSTTVGHTVMLFADTGVEPPATPSTLAEIEVPDGGTEGQDRLVDLSIDPPAVLQDGEQLFVAVQWTGTWPNPLCIETCSDSATQSDRNYWSTTTETPFSWVELASFGAVFNRNYLIEATGY